MKDFRTFFMEDWLETFRFQSKYNLGESGGRPRPIKELLTLSDIPIDDAVQTFLNMKLCDSQNYGRNDLREIIANFHPGAKVNNVLITTGTSEAIFLLFRYLKPKKVALALPAFQLLYEFPKAINAKIIPLPVRYSEDGRPFIDEEEWIKIIQNQKPDCLFINNPHNPSGIILNQNFVNKLSLLTKELGCYLIGDEHYRFLSSETESLGNTLYQNDDNTFITGSFIKCFGTPGLRIGWCLGPQKALDFMQNEKNYLTHTVNPLSEWLAFEILKKTDSMLFRTVKAEWLENKFLLNNFLSQSKTMYGIAPAGGLVTSLGFCNINSSIETENILNKLLKKGIFTLPLMSMEFGSFEFQNEKYYKNNKLSNINKGFGCRLGIGMEPSLFQNALSEIESTLLC